MPTALIWGASGGMGQALIEQLVAKEWRVSAAARDTDKIPDGVYDRYSFDAADHGAIKDIAVDLAHRTDGLDLWIYAAKMPEDAKTPETVAREILKWQEAGKRGVLAM